MQIARKEGKENMINLTLESRESTYIYRDINIIRVIVNADRSIMLERSAWRSKLWRKGKRLEIFSKQRPVGYHRRIDELFGPVPDSTRPRFRESIRRGKLK